MKRKEPEKVSAMELLKKYGQGWNAEKLQEIYNVLGDDMSEEAIVEAFKRFGSDQDQDQNAEAIISFILDYNDSAQLPPAKSSIVSPPSPTTAQRIQRTPLDTSLDSALRKWPRDTAITLRLVPAKVLELNGGFILNKHTPGEDMDPVLSDFIVLMQWPADTLDRMQKKHKVLSKLEIFDIMKVVEPGEVEDLDAILATKSQVPEFDCCICMDTYKVTEMYTIGCPGSHRLCFDCFGETIKHAVSQGDVVRCPYQGCGYVLSQQEIEGFGENEGGYISPEVVERYRKQNLNRALKSISGAIGCPTPGCGNYVILSKEDLARKTRCDCEGCKRSFCSHCRKTYHYHCKCDEVLMYTERWIEWCSQKREKYTTDKAKALEMKARNEELARNYENLKLDEEYKEKHGRVCPNCGRIIIKVDGCDLMVCGRNYHGGDVQDGCGSNFNWTKAVPYRSDMSRKAVKPMPVPDIAREVVHEGVRCNRCGEIIKGLRFTCIHCPCYDMCEKCEAEGTLNHNKDHIWKIITDPFDVD